MAKIVSKARQLRFQLQLKEGRNIPLVEVAERAGVDRRALTRLEQGKTERFDGDVLERLCAFYGVGIGEIIEYIDEGESEIMQKNETPAGFGATLVAA